MCLSISKKNNPTFAGPLRVFSPQIYKLFRMKGKLRLFSLLTLFIFSSLTLILCSDREEVVNCFPEQPVNVTLNLNLPAYFPLEAVGGWVYVDVQQAGTRGLIVVRTSNGFKVYDRNAPHICPDATTTLAVENNIKIICPKDGAEWILLTGEPIKVAPVSPKTYRYNYDPATATLSIFN